MRLMNNFINLNEQNETFKADFICECGTHKFTITHTGTKRIVPLLSILRKRHNQIRIKAECRNCHRIYTLYDSAIDGIKPKSAREFEFAQFFKNGNDIFELEIKYNFSAEFYKTDKFKAITIHIKDDSKTYRLI